MVLAQMLHLLQIIMQSTDAVFPADIKHLMKFVSLNVTFHSFPIGY